MIKNDFRRMDSKFMIMRCCTFWLFLNLIFSSCSSIGKTNCMNSNNSIKSTKKEINNYKFSCKQKICKNKSFLFLLTSLLFIYGIILTKFTCFDDFENIDLLIKKDIQQDDSFQFDNSSNNILFKNHITKKNINWFHSNTNPLINDKEYRDFDDFNSELFCPIKNHISNYENKLLLLKDLFEIQFPKNCHDKETKFFIVDDTAQKNGLFSLLSGWAIWLSKALAYKRIFLLKGNFLFAHDNICKELSHECFFLPISNCSADEMINTFKDNESNYFEYSPKLAKNYKYSFTPQDIIQKKSNPPQKVWYFRNFKGWMKDVTILNLISVRYNLTISEYINVIINFFLRLQPELERVVLNVIKKILIKFPNNKLKNSISMPLRYGAKCIGAKSKYNISEKKKLLVEKFPGIKNTKRIYTPSGEMYCFDPEVYMEIALIIQKLKPEIDTLILTCETASIIDKMEQLNVNYNNPFKIIKNEGDKMPGAKISKYGYEKNYDDLTNILGMLTSIRLQFAGRYFIFSDSSNWVLRIYHFRHFLGCLPLKYEKYENINKTMIELLIPTRKKRLNRFNKGVILNKELYDIYQKKNYNNKKFKYNISFLDKTTD